MKKICKSHTWITKSEPTKTKPTQLNFHFQCSVCDLKTPIGTPIELMFEKKDWNRERARLKKIRKNLSQGKLENVL